VSKCPFKHSQTNNKDWWPKQLNLKILHANKVNNPTSRLKSYKEEFAKLNLNELKQDIFLIMKDSKDWWPADYGH